MFRRNILFKNFYDKPFIFSNEKIKQQCLKFFDKDKNGILTAVEIYRITTITNELASTQYDKDTIIDLNILFPNLTSIYSNAFRYVSNLKRLIIPKTVNILNTCFYGSTIDEIIIEDLKAQESILWGLNFKTMVIKNKIPPVIYNKNPANYGWAVKNYSKIYVPDDAVDAYKSSPSFSEIPQNIFPISSLPSNF